MPKPNFSTPLISLDPVVVDTETTGLDVARARIIQIGAVRIRDGQLNEEDVFDLLVHPGEPIPASTIAIHGITDHLVAEAKRFSEIADPFTTFLGDAAIVGHNIGFDMAMFDREFTLYGGQWSVPPVLDTLMLSRIVNPLLPNFSLEVIANWLGVSVKNRHSALGDAVTTARIFLALLPLLREAGIRTLADAQAASLDLRQRLPDQAPYASDMERPGLSGDEGEQSAIQRIDSFPFQYRVRDVMTHPALIVGSQMTPAQLASSLSEERKSAAFVTLSGSRDGFGIVTERDLMRLLLTDGVKNVGEMANTPLLTVRDTAFVYQALSLMHEASIRHLGVIDSAGNLVGALSSSDLLRQRADDAIQMSGAWEGSSSVESLAANWGRLPVIARSLLDEGVDAPHIAAVLSEQLATVTRRAAEMAEAQMTETGKGGPPAPYSVLLLGSGSRGETLLAPDQDNAIVYEDGYSGADDWFAAYGKILTDILDQVGVPYCKGGVMASNADWRKDLKNWQATIQHWLKRAVWKELLNVDIFYDFRPVHGDFALALKLRDYAYDAAGASPGFVRQLSAMATSFGPALGYFGTFKTENGRVDLKSGGTLPIVSGARVMALRHGNRKRSTRRRIEFVRELENTNADDWDDLLVAHTLLLRLLLEQQLADMAAGIAPSNKVELKRLPKRTRAELKQAFERVALLPMALGEPLGSG